MAVSVCMRVCMCALYMCVCVPCDSLDELEIYNTGSYSKPRPKTVILPPLLAL